MAGVKGGKGNKLPLIDILQYLRAEQEKKREKKAKYKKKRTKNLPSLQDKKKKCFSRSSTAGELVCMSEWVGAWVVEWLGAWVARFCVRGNCIAAEAFELFIPSIGIS